MKPFILIITIAVIIGVVAAVARWLWSENKKQNSGFYEHYFNQCTTGLLEEIEDESMTEEDVRNACRISANYAVCVLGCYPTLPDPPERLPDEEPLNECHLSCKSLWAHKLLDL